MIKEDFLASLPEDPEDAFPLYHKHVYDKYIDDSKYASGYDQQQQVKEIYISSILGFISAHNIDMGIDQNIPNDSDDFRSYFSNAEKKITIFSAKLAVQSAWKTKGKNPSYVLTAPIRLEIHHYINLIKNKLNDIPLSQNKRDALFNSLNAFASEVDRDRTRADLITALYISLKRDASAGLDKVAPIIENVTKIMDCLSKAPEFLPRISSTKIDGILEGPQKQLPAPEPKDMDNGIPF
jgi:hypothetical protein